MHEFNTNPASIDRRGRGRPKGSRNVVTRAAKDVIQGVADKIGGLDRMAAWTKEDPLNERAFWSNIYPKLLPLTVAGQLDLSVNWPVMPPAIER
jgi:hypothetical protein